MLLALFIAVLKELKANVEKKVLPAFCLAHWQISHLLVGAAVAEWLSSWLAKQEVRGSIPRLAT